MSVDVDLALLCMTLLDLTLVVHAEPFSVDLFTARIMPHGVKFIV